MQLYFVPFLWFIFFALFHSITAHEIFKKKLEQITSPFFVEHFWRFIYCLISFYMLHIAFFSSMILHENFQPLIHYPDWAWSLLFAVRLIGLIIAYWAYLQFDYFEFWGVRQAIIGIRRLIKKEEWAPIPLAGVQRLGVRGIYHLCRHPMLTGGLLFILGLPLYKSTIIYVFLYLVYMFVGAYFEEKRLVTHFGEQYFQYRKQVGAFFPHLHQIKKWLKPSNA